MTRKPTDKEIKRMKEILKKDMEAFFAARLEFTKATEKAINAIAGYAQAITESKK